MKTPLILSLILIFFIGNLDAQNRKKSSEEEKKVIEKSQQEMADQRADVGRILDLYFQGVLTENMDLIPLAKDVLFVEPDGRTFEGIAEVKSHMANAASRITEIRIIASVIEGDYGCKVTEYNWSNGATTPVAICFRVRNNKIIEIRPYFDRPN